MKKQQAALVCSVMALAVGLAGCGQNNAPSAPSAGDASKSGSAAAGGPVKITIMSASQTETPAGPTEKSIADEYMKQHPNVKIEFIGVPMNDMYKKITALATGGDLPDAFTNTPEFMNTAYGMNITADLTKLLGADYLKEFYPNIIQESSVEGKLQFIPWTAAPQALIYRGDWFEKEGLKAPETWDDFLDAAKKLTKDTNGDGKADQWGFAMIGTRNTSGGTRFLPVLRSFGADELKKDASGKWITELNTPNAKAALQFYADLNNKYGVVPPGVTETGFPEAASLIATGKAGMIISGPNAIGTILSQNPDLKGKLYSAPIPKKEKNSATFGLLGYSVSEASKNKEAVADYLKFLVNKENALKMNESTGYLPTKADVGQSQQLSTPEKAGFVKALTFAYSAPTLSTYSQFYDIVAEAYQSMLASGSKITADDAAKKAADRANELIGKEGK
ncbi:ABC transporter substrate-binding protein [Paenibacillus thalictri]|uniref:Sugar ABC transporter substrate-binding protein n=1 Tax=Paenibacillus thalictri TaxID=2527873 RepID=A0A4Q9DGY0_9BACL|nr:sugar ABC transporter substrate-binding protein [Paenibacillus thalictri]TBL70093.1 sugar ABC transporter substrate-binding protein [Paenibacillus thalictri]